jgi:hypothetical protein
MQANFNFNNEEKTMSVISIQRISIGALGVKPGLVALTTDDDLATITAEGYLGNQTAAGQLSPGDIVKAFYLFDGTSGVYKEFAVSISSGINTLVPVSSNLITFDVTVGQASLASGGSVVLKTSNGTERYKIRSLQLNSGGTNFSGGSGDRLGQVTDGTTVYSVIPAATMQSLANAQWGATALPNPASAAINTSTVAGADLVFKYSGGTLDYTAGSLVISGVLERVA